MPNVELHGVTAEYQVLSVLDYNLKNRVVQSVRRRQQPPVVIQALRDIDLSLPEGTRLGLMGPNGAGKSTLLAIIAGVLPPIRGRVSTQGRVLALLGGAGAGLSQEATGLENVVGMGVQLGEAPASMRRRVPDIAEFSALGDRLRHPVYTYSTGMQARLRFSIITSLQPDVLLLDEGLATADAAFTRRAGERMRSFLSAAGVVVFAAHSEDLLLEHCDSGLVLDSGRIAAQGTMAQAARAYRSLSHHEARGGS